MKILRSVLFALTVLVMATAAQAQQTNLKADIPFDFVVGDRTYPAGEYALKSMTMSDVVIRIDNTKEDLIGNIISNQCTSAKPATDSKLIFHRMGDHYFLYQIWVAGNSSGRQFTKSREEVELAQNHEKLESTIVAAKIIH